MKRYVKAAVSDLLDEDPEVIREIARTSSDTELLQKIFEHYGNPKDYEYFYCLDLAQNENTPKDILTKLADFRYDTMIRAAVAENPNTPVKTLYGLTKYSYTDILRGLAKNVNAPQDLLSKLSKDLDVWVCAHVAGNPNTSREDLVALSKHSDPSVRYAVAKNRNVPREIIETLADDPNRDVHNLVSTLLEWYNRMDQHLNEKISKISGEV